MSAEAATTPDADRLAAIRAEFPRVPGYLNVATKGLPPAGVSRVLADDLAAWQRGGAGAPDADLALRNSRQKYARLVGVDADNISVGSQVSVAAGLVAANVAQLQAGTEVLCAEADFGSVLFPFLTQAAAGGYTVRTVPLERLIESIGDETALVAVSAVQSADGRGLDLEALRDAAAAHGAWTLIDLTQAVGWMPFGAGAAVSAADFDITVTGAFKWLCSPRGATLTSLSDRAIEALRPINTSWYSGEEVWGSTYGPTIQLAKNARRFDVAPVAPAFIALDAALDTFTPENVELISAWDLGLARQFCSGIGIAAPESPIVSVPDPEGAIFEEAVRRGLKISARAGSARFAFHIFNDADDATAAVDTVLAARS